MIDVQNLLWARAALRASEQAEMHGDVPEAIKQGLLALDHLRAWNAELFAESNTEELTQ